jgi:hypothetical protein
LRDADFLKARLQLAIVEERNLHGTIRSQWPAQKIVHTLRDLRVLWSAAIPVDALSDSFANRRLHAIERRIGCKTTGQSDESRDDYRRRVFHLNWKSICMKNLELNWGEKCTDRPSRRGPNAATDEGPRKCERADR